MEGAIKIVLSALGNDGKIDAHEQKAITAALQGIVAEDFSQSFIEAIGDGIVELDEFNKLVGDPSTKAAVQFARKFLDSAGPFIDEDVKAVLELEKAHEMELVGFRHNHIAALKEILPKLPVSFTKGTRAVALDKKAFANKCRETQMVAIPKDADYVEYLTQNIGAFTDENTFYLSQWEDFNVHTFIHEMTHARIFLDHDLSEISLINTQCSELGIKYAPVRSYRINDGKAVPITEQISLTEQKNIVLENAASVIKLFIPKDLPNYEILHAQIAEKYKYAWENYGNETYDLLYLSPNDFYDNLELTGLLGISPDDFAKIQEEFKNFLSACDIGDGGMLFYEWRKTGGADFYAKNDGKYHEPYEYGEIYLKKLKLLMKYGLLSKEVFADIVALTRSGKYIDKECNEDKNVRVCHSIPAEQGGFMYGISSHRMAEDICDMLAFCYSHPAHIAGLIRNAVE